MKTIRKFDKQPDNSIIAKNLGGEIHYLDSFGAEIENPHHYSIDYLTALLFSSFPNWANRLMRLRNFLVNPFGLETVTIPEQGNIETSVRYNVGDRAVFFTVTDRSESEIVMAENDKHLYFRTSLFVDWPTNMAYLTTLVHFHNVGGKLYFAPVKPFHKLIMVSLLTNFSKTLQHGNR